MSKDNRPLGSRMRGRRAMLIVSTVLCSGTVVPAFAQVAAPAPVRNNIDQNNVDLFLGTMNIDGPVLSAGDGESQGLTWQKLMRGKNGWGDTIVGTLSVSGAKTFVTFGGLTRAFTLSGSTYTSTEGDGASLTKSGTTYTLVTSDGTVSIFTSSYAGAYPYGSVQGNVTSVTRPDGVQFTYNYASAYYCASSKEGSNGPICLQRRYAYRIASVTSNAKYRLTFQYANDASSFDQNDASANDWSGWGDITSVTLSNAVTGGGARSQSFRYITGGYTITDAMGRLTTYRYAPYNGAAAGAIAGITRPGSASEDVTISYDGAGKVASVANASGTTAYTYSDSGNRRTTTVTDQLGHSTSYVFDIALQRPISSTDATGNTTTSTYDPLGRSLQVTYPEGNYTKGTYDDRGNVTQTQIVAKPGSGTPTLTTTASFPCTTAATCNKPAWTKDAKGNQTNYAYDTSTGNVTSITGPANPSGVRPTTTFTYAVVNGIQMLSSSSTCSSAETCVNTANETRTTVSYNANGLPTATTVQAGDGSTSSTTTKSYDDVGNVISVDGPIAGSEDTVTYRYNANREVIGMVGPDPDGGGPRRRRAQRDTYDIKGRVTQTEIGTVSDASDGAWSAFASQQQVVTSFDGVDRPVSKALTAGGTTYATTTFGYDRQRLDTVTVAMSGQGANRTTKYSYDNADRQTKVTSAFGTPEQADDVTISYSANGKTASQADANGNVTTYGYDGLDRQTTVTYPGGSYDQVTYDANGNVTSRRLRDGQTLTYDFDALNRRTFDHNPKTNIAEVDVGYGYDLFGRLTGAGDGNGWTKNYSYDALGRATTQSSNIASTTLQYDAAGRKTRQTWADGFYVTYEYNAAGQMTVIRENGGLALVAFAYDDLGRRTSLSRGNGTVTSYGFDGASRLTSLTQDLAGSAWDQTYSFTYNPAGQILSRSTSNDAYAWTGGVNVDRGYAVNALNQYTSAGSITFGYDARGNLINSGGTTYQYNSRNQLFMNAAGQLIYRNPAGELGQTPGVNFDWVDGQLAQESSGSVLRRYVYGPNPDEVLVWYEGAGTSDRRYLHADERGSVVAISNDAGNAIAINSYDEYGIPGTNNQGRFQYTGQAWLPELGMYDYKARMYSPTLGRFMQTDPIGYSDGMNWYSYVGNDPVNKIDPSGLKLVWACVDNRCGWKDDGSGYLSPGSIRGTNPGFGNRNRVEGNANQHSGAPKAPQNNPCSQMGTAMSPRQYANLGRQASLGNGASTNSAGNSSNLLPLGRLASNLFDFRRNGPLDAEAHGSTKAYGNYTFGVYTRAAGFSLKETLDGADLFGRLFSSYDFNTNPADSYATHIPKVNADAIRAGYADGANASSCGRQ